MEKVVILGAGTWGTALANLLVSKNIDTTVYTRFEDQCIQYSTTRIHPNLPKGKIYDDVKFSCSLEECVPGKTVVVFALPSPYVRETAVAAKKYITKDQIIITVAKGMEEGSLLTMSEILEDVLGDIKVVALSGPTHAEEVSVGLPTAIVAASKDEEAALRVQELFATPYMRVYTNSDVYGVELCGALKNIIALAAGMSDGLGFGDNAKAAIITRGLGEITRLGTKMGCNLSTFYGLAGIGDIVVTATSTHSRNHNAGKLLGQGKSLKETLDEIGMVVEGLNALDAARELEQKYDVELPIVNAVYSVIHEGVTPMDAVESLFLRKQISE